jgi:hypothetical protein
VSNALFNIAFAVAWGQLLLSFESRAQNLVPNPSFELIDSCPPYPNSLGYQDGAAPIGWWRWSNTPDYFNGCATDTIGDVPGNIFGYQPAYDGQAYSGMTFYHDTPDSFREMIGAQLTTPLVPGTTYYASMYVSSGYGGYYDYFVFSNKMGMLFTQQPYVGGWMNPSYPLRNYSQIWQPTVVPDTAGWTLVSGSFVADSAYQYLVIGNHFDNTLTDTSWAGSATSFSAYYYVDFVCVSTSPTGCFEDTGFGEEAAMGFSIWPNPVVSSFVINGLGNKSHRALILDPMGRLVMSFDCSAGSEYDVRSLANGSYALLVLDVHGEPVARIRFIKS